TSGRSLPGNHLRAVTTQGYRERRVTCGPGVMLEITMATTPKAPPPPAREPPAAAPAPLPPSQQRNVVTGERDPDATRRSFKETLREYLDRRLLTIFIFGIASGFPWVLWG